MSYVEICNINKSYQNKQVLNNINLSINKGEFVTLLGPSGCGKTTLLRIIAGLEPADEGKVIVNKREIREGEGQKNIGMVFQSYALFPNMTAYENIAFGLKIRKTPADVIKKQVAEMMEVLGIKGKENNYPHQMSGGQQQRVALARALVTKPDVLLLDEPLSAVDAKVRESARILIRDIQRQLGITTIFVTHDQSEALVMSDRIVIMNNGHIMQEGTPDEIYHRPSNEFVADFVGTFNLLPASLLKRGGEENVLIRPEKIKIARASEKGQFEGQKGALITGTVHNEYILGNTVRTEVKVQDKTVLVDRLNNSRDDYLKEGEEVAIFISEDALTVLKKS